MVGRKVFVWGAAIIAGALMVAILATIYSEDIAPVDPVGTRIPTATVTAQPSDTPIPTASPTSTATITPTPHSSGQPGLRPDSGALATDSAPSGPSLATRTP